MGIVRQFTSCNRAAAAAELALILPLLLVILFGGFEAGAYLWTEQKVIKGVRDGARFAGRQSFSLYSCDGVDSDLETQIKNLTRTGQLSSGTAKISGWNDDDVTVSVACQAPVADTYTAGGLYEKQPDGAIHVTVSATVPYPSFFATLGFDTRDAVVHASANAAVMGS